MSLDLPVIYRAPSVEQADVLVAWLADHGVDAMLKDRHAAGNMETPFIVAPRGVEVCVADLETAQTARTLIEEFLRERDHLREIAAARPPLDAACEDCGKRSTWPGDQQDSVQTCPHCGAYMDVPAPDAIE